MINGLECCLSEAQLAGKGSILVTLLHLGNHHIPLQLSCSLLCICDVILLVIQVRNMVPRSLLLHKVITQGLQILVVTFLGMGLGEDDENLLVV